MKKYKKTNLKIVVKCQKVNVLNIRKLVNQNFLSL